jgi:hypothetical protein
MAGQAKPSFAELMKAIRLQRSFIAGHMEIRQSSSTLFAGKADGGVFV